MKTTNKNNLASLDANHFNLSLVFVSPKGKEKSIQIPVMRQLLQHPYLAVAQEINGYKEPVLFEVKHTLLQTLVDLTNVKPLQVLGFDENGQFIGVNKVGKSHGATFQLLHQARYFLILQTNTPLSFQTLKKIIKP